MGLSRPIYSRNRQGNQSQHFWAISTFFPSAIHVLVFMSLEMHWQTRRGLDLNFCQCMWWLIWWTCTKYASKSSESNVQLEMKIWERIWSTCSQVLLKIPNKQNQRYSRSAARPEFLVPKSRNQIFKRSRYPSCIGTSQLALRLIYISQVPVSA